MELRVLGPVGVSIAANHVELGAGKELAIVAALGMAAGRFVSADQLTEQVWDGRSPGKTTLQGNISRIRRKLVVPEGTLRIVERSRAYRLEIDADAIDWHRFRKGVTEAESLIRAGVGEEALGILDEVLALWTGDPLTGVDGMWADGWRELMRNARASAMARWAEASLRVRPADDVSSTISEFAAEFPLDERLTCCLMEALHTSGRTPDALAAYVQFEKQLARRFGTDPGPRVKQLHGHLLSGGPSRTAVAPQQVEPAPPQRDNLVHDIADFTDRTRELAHLNAAASGDGGVHVVNGLPGMGKSTLALHAAHQVRARFPDARFYLDLRGSQEGAQLEPSEALQELLAMHGVKGDAVPAGLEQRAALWRDQVSDKRMLLVLDHARTPEQVRPLLPGSPESMVLITTERRLSGLDGARYIQLQPPDPPEAEELLAAVSGRDYTEGPAEMRTLVELCDRLPLALRLLGRWLRRHPTWTLVDVRDRLMETGDLIRGLPEVGAKLEAVLTLAVKEISPQARALFLRIGTHPDGQFSLGAASALAGLEPDSCEPLLEELLDCHFIKEIRPYQYRIDGLVGAFAGLTAQREVLEPDLRAAHLRLVEYYVCSCRAADRILDRGRARMPVYTLNEFRSPRFAGTADAAAWFVSDRPTLLSVATWAFGQRHLAEYAARLAHAMAASIRTYGPREAAPRLHAAAVRVWRERNDHAALAYALIDQARCMSQIRKGDAALECAREADRLWRGIGDTLGEAVAIEQIGLALAMSDRLREARPYLLRAVRLHRNGLSPVSLADCLNNYATCAKKLGDLQGASEKFTEALELYRSYDDLSGMASVYSNHAGVFHEMRHHREAFGLLEQALGLTRQMRDRPLEGNVQANLGEVRHSRGLYRQALRHFAEALRIHREVGNRTDEVKTLISAGQAYRALGAVRKAIGYFESARRLAPDFAGPEPEASVLIHLGEAYSELREDDRAEALIGDAREIAAQEGLPVTEIKALKALGQLHWRRGRDDTAYPLLKEAETLGATVQAPTEMADVKWLLDAIEMSRGTDEQDSGPTASHPPGRPRVPRPRTGADVPSTRRPPIGTSDQAG